MVDGRIQIRNSTFQKSMSSSDTSHSYSVWLRKQKRASIIDLKRATFIQRNSMQIDTEDYSPSQKSTLAEILLDNNNFKDFILELKADRETTNLIFTLKNFILSMNEKIKDIKFDDEVVEKIINLAYHENLRIKQLAFLIFTKIFTSSVELTKLFVRKNIINTLLQFLFPNHFISVSLYILPVIKCILYNMPECTEIFCTDEVIKVFIRLLSSGYSKIVECILDVLCVISNSFNVISESLAKMIIAITIKIIKNCDEILAKYGLYLIYSALKKNTYILSDVENSGLMQYLIQNISSNSKELVSHVQQFIIFLIFSSKEYAETLISHGLNQFLNTNIENYETRLVNFILECFSNLVKYKEIAKTLSKQHLLKACLNMVNYSNDQIRIKIISSLLTLTDYKEDYIAFELYQLNIIESMLPLLTKKFNSIVYPTLKIFHNLFECLSNISTANMYYKITDQFLKIGGYDVFDSLLVDTDKQISSMAKDFMTTFILIE